MICTSCSFQNLCSSATWKKKVTKIKKKITCKYGKSQGTYL